MKLSDQFIIYQESGETLLVPTAGADFAGVVRGNKTFAAILGLLSGDITEAEIVDRLKERFDADDGVIEADVRATLARLRSLGAIDEK